jgi:hypothetical protein
LDRIYLRKKETGKGAKLQVEIMACSGPAGIVDHVDSQHPCLPAGVSGGDSVVPTLAVFSFGVETRRRP